MSNVKSTEKGAFMRKYAILLAALAVMLMAGCEGDDPGGAGGTLPTVTGLTIDTDASEGTSIVLTWTAVDEADEYEIYFNESGTPGSGDAVTTTANTTYTHEATSAGYYSVRAKSGDNYSESFATAVNTMPVVITETFVIGDQNAQTSYDSGFYFGDVSGSDISNYGTRSVANTNTYDIYAYDDTKGDDDVLFYAGNYGTYGDAYDSDFGIGGTSGYAPDSWADNESDYLSTGDMVYVRQVYTDPAAYYYVKVNVDDVSEDPPTQNGTLVTLSFEFQTIQNVRVF